jgi:hypothetical protein
VSFLHVPAVLCACVVYRRACLLYIAASTEQQLNHCGVARTMTLHQVVAPAFLAYHLPQGLDRSGPSLDCQRTAPVYTSIEGNNQCC